MKNRPGPCAKQIVTATLVSPSGATFVGTNYCNAPQDVCPRDEQGMASGEGYHLCKTICDQPAHAEVNAIKLAGQHAQGGIITLTGHTYACNDCQQAADAANVTINVAEVTG